MKKIKTITLSDVVKILNGDNIYTGCGLDLAQCNENSLCSLHFKFIDIREQLTSILENISLEILVNKTIYNF